MSVLLWIFLGLVVWLVVGFIFALLLGPFLAENSKHYPEVK
jgi:hypothetical protein